MHIWLAIAAAGLCALAEVLHAGRVRRVANLAFGASGMPRGWARSASFIRATGCAAVCWGMLTLMASDGKGADALMKESSKKKAPDRHLIVAMDVSPSMGDIKDAGPAGKISRRERARDVLRSALARIDLARTRVSMIGFWDTAKPVVVDTFDMNIIENAVADLPLMYAFKGGKTDLQAGVREAMKLAEPWAPGSTTLLVISDGGDAVGGPALAPMPASIGDVLVVGVGDPFRSTAVEDVMSRQDRESLDRLASRLRGLYYDANTQHLPTTVLRSLKMLNMSEQGGVALRTIALVCMGVGGAFVGLIGPMLGLLGAKRAVMPRRRHPVEGIAVNPTMSGPGGRVEPERSAEAQPFAGARA